ncbi:CBS domain containing protein [Actinobacteria bacterium OK006]|nr:CBS domain containing protein [Actinobacteria bacterium OK006]
MTQRVSDVMNKAPGTVERQTSVAVVARVMRDEDVGAVLVAEGERLRGLPTCAATIWSR